MRCFVSLFLACWVGLSVVPTCHAANSSSHSIRRFMTNLVLEGQLLLRNGGRVVSFIPASKMRGTIGRWRVVRSTLTIRLRSFEKEGQAKRVDYSEYRFRGIRLLSRQRLVVRFLSYKSGRSVFVGSSGTKRSRRWTQILRQKKVVLQARRMRFTSPGAQGPFGLKASDGTPLQSVNRPVLMIRVRGVLKPLNPRTLTLWGTKGSLPPSTAQPSGVTPPGSTTPSAPQTPGMTVPSSRGKTIGGDAALASRSQIVRFLAESVLEDHLLILQGGRLRSFLGVYKGHSFRGTWKVEKGAMSFTIVEKKHLGDEEKRIQSKYVFRGVTLLSNGRLKARYFRYYAGKGHHFLRNQRKVIAHWTTVKTRANLVLFRKALPSYRLRFRSTTQQKAKTYRVLTIRYRGRFIPLIGKKM
jgi:hypothetical protein